MTMQFQAEYFFNAFEVLRDNNEAVMDRLEKSPGEPLIGTKKTLGTRLTIGVDIVCLAFSVELYIKNVHHAIKGKAPRGHNILKLFEQLPKPIQQEIFTYHSIAERGWSYEKFRKEIKAISDGFEKWRYSYESKSLRYNEYCALILIEALTAVTGSVLKSSN